MIYTIALLTAVSVALAVYAVAELVPRRSRMITRQLAMIAQLSRGESMSREVHRGVWTRDRLTRLLNGLGASIQQRWGSAQTLRDLLIQAGYRRPEAATVFTGARLAAAISIPVAAMLLGGAAGLPGPGIFLAGLWGAAAGWIAPKVYLRKRSAVRRAEIERRLPDALDLLVVCMDAGLGLNQAILKMAEEIKHFSPATADEFMMVNLELRAGVPRMDALRNLGTRMGVAELRSLAAMLIQADRFGTSIAHALRIHAESARNKRRQLMEEAAAKTTIKLIFPLVLCIFPALFVVILGPAVISIIRTLSQL